MKTVYIIFLLSAALSFFSRFILSTNYYQPDEIYKEEQTVTIVISAVGDLMCHSVQYNYARVEKDSFDFTNVFSEVKPYFQESDFTFGNLETVLAGKKLGYSGYPRFNTPDAYAYALKTAGFDLITTANNHSLDQGEFGLRRTIEQLDKIGLCYNGTYTSQRDSDSIRIFNIKGIKIAFLAYTYGTNGYSVPSGKPYLINFINFDKIKSDIEKSRSSAADLVLIHFHFGEEYQREPNKYQKEAVEFAIEHGADIIIGGHPHVLQPAKFYKSNTGKLDSGFVAYSLGNFISNQRWRYSDAGAILNLFITKNFTKDSIFISKAEFIPTWVFKGDTQNGKEFIILPAESAYFENSYTFLRKKDIELMKQSFEDSKSILTKYDRRIEIREGSTLDKID
jgi:poly-gamma-glutamate synthesis protein (capsule biosynthesis protein)